MTGDAGRGRSRAGRAGAAQARSAASRTAAASRVRALLAAEAERHQPDRLEIHWKILDASAGSRPGARLRHRHEQARTVRRRPRMIAVAAGAALAVGVAVVGAAVYTAGQAPDGGPASVLVAPADGSAGASGSETRLETAPATPAVEPSESAGAVPVPPGFPASSSPPTPLTPTGRLAAAIGQQVEAGALDPEAARDLLRELDETGEAEEKLPELGRKLAELRRDGKLTAAGYDALTSLDPLLSSVPDSDEEHGRVGDDEGGGQDEHPRRWRAAQRLEDRQMRR